jgi:long-chain acyl-CoA synthetase
VVGDRRPYLVALVTLDPEVATEETAEIRESIQETVDEVNSKVGPVEQIKYFAILPQDLSQETGELTPTMKVKRNVVHEKFADVIDSLYEQGQAKQAG